MFRLKTTCILVYSLIFNNAIFSQSPVGAWERYYDDNFYIIIKKILGDIIFDYDGKVYGSDELRMMAKMIPEENFHYYDYKDLLRVHKHKK